MTSGGDASHDHTARVAGATAFAGGTLADGCVADGCAVQNAARRLAFIFTILLVALSLVRAGRSQHVGGDFLRYHRAGRLVATGQAERIYDARFLREQSVFAEERAAERAARGKDADNYDEEEFKYDPSFAVLMAPLGPLHPRTGWTIWGGWNGLMIGLTFAAAWSLSGLSWPWALLAVALLAHKCNANLNLGQINPTAICAATGAMWFASRGSQVSAGVAGAFGAAVKYLPALVTPYLAVKGAWKGVAAFLGSAAFFFLGLPALVLGPSRAWALFVEHKEIRAKFFTGAAPDDLPGHSIKSFVYRVFGGTHYQTGRGDKRIDLDISVVHLSPELLKWTVLALDAVVLVVALRAVATSGRKAAGGETSGRQTDAPAPSAESIAPRPRLRTALGAGLLVSTITLVSPEARAPHFLYLALPVCALLAGVLTARREGWPCARAATWLAVAGGILLQTDSGKVFGYASEVMSAYCFLGWANLALFAALLLLLHAERRAATA